MGNCAGGGLEAGMLRRERRCKCRYFVFRWWNSWTKLAGTSRSGNRDIKQSGINLETVVFGRSSGWALDVHYWAAEAIFGCCSCGIVGNRMKAKKHAETP